MRIECIGQARNTTVQVERKVPEDTVDYSGLKLPGFLELLGSPLRTGFIGWFIVLLGFGFLEIWIDEPMPKSVGIRCLETTPIEYCRHEATLRDV